MPTTTPLPNLKDWRFSVDFEGIAWALIDREEVAVLQAFDAKSTPASSWMSM